MIGAIKGSVIQARDLASKESSACPFVIIGTVDAEGEFINKKATLKSPVQKKTLFPIWGWEFTFELQRPAVGLRVEVWDDSSHDFLGYFLIRDLRETQDAKKWYTLEARYGKKDKVKGDVEVSFTFTAAQPPARLNVHFPNADIVAVPWEKDKTINAILSEACQKKGLNLIDFDVTDGTTKQAVNQLDVLLGDLWATDLILEASKKKGKKKVTAKGERAVKTRSILRSALSGFVYGYVLRAKGLGNKESEAVRAIIGPVSGTNEFMVDDKKNKMILKTKPVKDKNPEFTTFFQFPAKPPVSALKLQISVESEIIGEVLLEDMPDSTEVKRFFPVQNKKKDKAVGEVEVQYMYISDKSAAEGKTHPYDTSARGLVPEGQFSGYIRSARNLISMDPNGFSDPYCIFGIIDDSDNYVQNDDNYDDDDDDEKEIDEESKKAVPTKTQNEEEQKRRKYTKKTKIQKKTLNPEWENYFEYAVSSPPKGFKIEIWDYDEVGADEFMGTVIIKNITDGNPIDDWFTLTSPHGKQKVTGDVHLQLMYLSSESLAAGKAPPFSTPTGKKKKKKEYEGPLIEAEAIEGIIAGYVIRAKDLTSKDSNGLSDPYCVFGPVDPHRKYCFDDELHISMKEKTPTQFKTLHPVWKTYFEFKVKAPVCAFRLEVWDWDKVGQDDFMGEVIITNFPNNSELKQWLPLSPHPNSKDQNVKGQIEIQYTFISEQSLAGGAQVPYDMAERKRLEKEKTERDQIDKGDFTFLKVATYEAPNFEGGFFRTKLFTDPKWEDTYCIIFYDIWLIYPIPNKGIQPEPLTKPIGHVRLDRFNYKSIKQIENRVVSSGLIPKNERYTNTFAIGVGEKECLVECSSPEDMAKWIEKVTTQVKNLLRGRKFLQQNNPDDLIQNAKTVLPLQNPPVKHPIEGQEEVWMNQMKQAFESFRNLKQDIKHLSYFYRFNSVKNKDYINWFITPPQDVAHPSLERALQECEEKWMQQTWKNSFTNFNKAQEKLATITSVSLSQKEELAEYCQRMTHYIFLYNLYNAKLYKRKPSFQKAKTGWENALQIVNNSIKDEKAAIKAKQEELRQARLAEIQKQRELLENARKEYEAQLRDPFSITNMLNDTDDPFVDVVVDEVVDAYGEFVF